MSEQKKSLLFPLRAALALALSLPSSAFGASATWDGDTSGAWNNSANWSAAFPNANGDIATFNIDSPNNTISLGQNITVRQLLFDTANVGAYTINGASTELLFANSGPLGITLNSAVGAVTQTINARANLQLSTSFTNNSSLGSLNLAGGVNNNSASPITATFTGAGNGGTINGLTQTGGGALAITLNNTGGIYNITGTHTASGLLTVSGLGGTTRLSSDLSSTSGTTLTGGHLQINNTSPSGGLNATAGITQAGILEAFGADRTINTTNHTLNASTFQGTQSLTIESLATISGASGQITNNISGAGKTLTFNNAGNFSLSESSTNRIRTITGTGHTIISSNVINGGGSTASGITKTGTGTLELSGNNSYAGLTTVSGGVLLLNSANALGASGGTTNLLINTGGVVGLGNGDFTRGLGAGVTQVRFSGTGGGFAAYGADRNVNIGGASGTVTWNGTNFIPNGGSLVLGSATSTNKVTLQNPVALANADRTVQVNNGSAAVDGEISGVISSTTPASGSLTKTGEGTLNLSGANTFTGLTSVNAGTLLVNGSLAGGATVASGATLGGDGTISGAVTINSSANLAPGNSPGSLDTGALTLEGTLSMELNGLTVGTQYDQVNVTGGVTLLTGNSISLTLGFTPADGNQFFLINNDSTDAISGLLNGYAQDSFFTAGGQDWQISYTGNFGTNAFTGGNDLVIKAVPEPTTIGLLTAGLMTLCFRRRRSA